MGFPEIGTKFALAAVMVAGIYAQATGCEVPNRIEEERIRKPDE